MQTFRSYNIAYQPVELNYKPHTEEIPTKETENSPWSEGNLYRMLDQMLSTSTAHGRNLDWIHNGEYSWTDRFGHIYTAWGIKGWCNLIPQLNDDEDMPYGVKTMGRMDTMFLDRTQKASNFMRENGLETERFRRIHKITNDTGDFTGSMAAWKVINKSGLPFSGAFLSSDSEKHFKQLIGDFSLLKDPEFRQYLGKIVRNPLSIFDLKRYKARKEYIDSAEFAIVEREYPVAERLRDLGRLNTQPEDVFYLKDGEILFRPDKSALNDGPNSFNEPEFFRYLQRLRDKADKLYISSRSALYSSERVKATAVNRGDVEYWKSHMEQRIDAIPTAIMQADNPEGLIASGFSFRKALSNVFKYINEYKKEHGLSNEELSADRPEDIKFYYTEYLPHQMGNYLARFHNLGLHHRYPQGHNWGGAGHLYDNDSVTGKSFYPDDPDLTVEMCVRDITGTLGAILEAYSLQEKHKYSRVFANGVDYVYKGYLAQAFGEDAVKEMVYQSLENFIAEYKKNLTRIPFQEIVDQMKDGLAARFNESFLTDVTDALNKYFAAGEVGKLKDYVSKKENEQNHNSGRI